MRVEGGDPRIGFVVGISRAHSVLPWEVLGGVGATGATSAGTRSRCPQNSPRLFGATLLFQLQEGGRGGEGGGGTRATPPRVPVAVLSSTESHVVSPHAVRAARADPRPCAQPVHTRAHVQGAACTRISRSRRCGGSARRATCGLAPLCSPEPGPFGARLLAPGGAGPVH